MSNILLNPLKLIASRFLLILARGFAQRGVYNPALPILNTAINLRPDQLAAYTWRGKINYEQNNVEQALQDFNTAVELDSSNTYALSGRALIYDEMADYEKAIADFNQILSICTQFKEVSDAYIGRGNSFKRAGNTSTAIEDYNAALDTGNDTEKALLFRGLTYEQEGNIEAALTDLAEAVRIAPQLADANFLRAAIYKKLGNDEQAQIEYNLAIKKNPKLPETTLLHVTEHMTHRKDAAIITLQDLLLLSSEAAFISRVEEQLKRFTTEAESS